MPRILLVDDDQTTTELLKMLFELDGFDVLTAARGTDVIGIVETQSADIVLMDYHLADVQGVEVLRQIRRHPRLHALPVVIGSGMNVESEVIQAGATRFLIKPYDPSALSPLLIALIG